MAGPTITERESRPSAPSAPPVPRGGRRPRLPGRRATLLLLTVAVVWGGFGVWAFYGSDWLRIDQVRVSGVQALTEQQVLDAAAIPAGAPMASLDQEATERRLRERLPRIRSVRAEREWPDRVDVYVTERRPQLLQVRRGQYHEVDIEGVRYAAVATPPRGVPLLVMEHERSPSLRYFGTERLRREAARVAGALPRAVRRETRTVRVRSYDVIVLELTGGRTVRWGSGERSAAKARSLAALMKAEKDATHFDVSAPSAPAAAVS